MFAGIGPFAIPAAQMHRDSMEDGVIFMGAMFYAVSVIMFNGFADLSMAIVKLPTFYKQRDLLFFPPWAYALPTWFLKIPITIIEVSIWVFSTYYVTGFDPSIARMFKQYIILFLASQMASALFRFIASIGRSMTVSNSIGSFITLILFTLGGFILSRGTQKIPIIPIEDSSETPSHKTY